MSLKGFTLAEVLITLGIIGVVAALTTPAIVRNSENAKIGPTLAKMASTIETAIQAACNDQEKYYFRDIFDPDAVTDTSLNAKIGYLAENYMRARVYAGTFPTNIVDMKGEAYDVGTGTSYIFPDKSVLKTSDCAFGNQTVTNPDGSESTVNVSFCEVYVFMPGFQNKHRVTLGKDYFPLAITTKGEVLPPGQAEGTNVADQCTDDQIDNATITGYYCTDRVANNGWKADWK